MREKLFHICNKSAKILFRAEDDYQMAINRLASCSYNTATRVLAYSILSTHFHLIVKTDNFEQFLKTYKRNIAIWHNHKYNANIHLQTSYRELLNEGELITAINYVLKNPVHHSICEVAFLYPYSSVNCYFPELFCIKEYEAKDTIDPSELLNKEYRIMFGRQSVPNTYRIIDNKEIVPNSFVEYKSIRFLYKSIKSFVYNMVKNMQEELNMFPDEDTAAKESMNRFSLFSKISDLELCTMIDSRISPKSYTQLSDIERNQLWQWLKTQGVGLNQFNRAI